MEEIADNEGTKPAFKNSRKPLAAKFTFRDDKNRLFVIVNHFNSKSGDSPLYGRIQPPLNFSEIQRHKKAEVVNAFVKQILQIKIVMHLTDLFN